MIGTAFNVPDNHIVWSNGMHSMMPDWQTTRQCAVASQMLDALMECRTVLLTVGRPGAFIDKYDEKKLEEALTLAVRAIDFATGNKTPMPRPPGGINGI